MRQRFAKRDFDSAGDYLDDGSGGRNSLPGCSGQLLDNSGWRWTIPLCLDCGWFALQW
jgi:hypothetical protein